MFRHACRLGFEGILFHKGCSIGSSSERFSSGAGVS
jgi:hypothetical protein